jgi:hypothetical protein
MPPLELIKFILRRLKTTHKWWGHKNSKINSRVKELNKTKRLR